MPVNVAASNQSGKPHPHLDYVLDIIYSENISKIPLEINRIRTILCLEFEMTSFETKKTKRKPNPCNMKSMLSKSAQI